VYNRRIRAAVQEEQCAKSAPLWAVFGQGVTAMEPLNLSANALATARHVPANRITGILHVNRGITADTACA